MVRQHLISNLGLPHNNKNISILQSGGGKNALYAKEINWWVIWKEEKERCCWLRKGFGRAKIGFTFQYINVRVWYLGNKTHSTFSITSETPKNLPCIYTTASHLKNHPGKKPMEYFRKATGKKFKKSRKGTWNRRKQSHSLLLLWGRFNFNIRSIQKTI